MNCPSCGAHPSNDSTACPDMFNECLAEDFSNYLRFRHHRRFVDIYCLQHPDPYCRSAISLAAHLTGVYCAQTYGEEDETLRDVNRNVQQWLSSRPTLVKPNLPQELGTLTVAHVYGLTDLEEYAVRLAEWSSDVWAAYAEHHDLAKAWVAKAMGWNDK